MGARGLSWEADVLPDYQRHTLGLGPDPHVEKAVISWPSGTVQILEDLTLDTLHTVKEQSPR